MLVVQLFPVRSVWAAIAETRQEEISKDLSAIVFKLKSKASWLKLCHSRSSAKHLELGLQNAWILQIAYMQSILTKDHLPCFRSFAYVPLGTGPKQKQIPKKRAPAARSIGLGAAGHGSLSSSARSEAVATCSNSKRDRKSALSMACRLPGRGRMSGSKPWG